MALKIRRSTAEELRNRKESLTTELSTSLGGDRRTSDDLKILARSGQLTVDERRTYDELRRVELLLGEG